MGNLASLNFNAATVEPSTGFKPIPAGEYDFLITGCSLKDNKEGGGKHIEVVYQCVEGAAKGRKIYERMNVVNASERAQAIGQAELSSLCRAVGVMEPKDTKELCNKIVRLKVGVKVKDGKEGNVVNARMAAGVKPPVTSSAPF